jgi:auxin efflux carrier family protein
MLTGPPATKLTALADVGGTDEDEKMSITKFITISYAVSLIICFAVVGSLKASLAIKL